MHRHFLRIISQNPEYVKIFCSDLTNPFRLSYPYWSLDNQSP